MAASGKFRNSIQVSIKSANDIALLDTKFLSNFYFRGQGDSTWQLSSSLERMVSCFHPRADLFELLQIYE